MHTTYHPIIDHFAPYFRVISSIVTVILVVNKSARSKYNFYNFTWNCALIQVIIIKTLQLRYSITCWCKEIKSLYSGKINIQQVLCH